MYTTHASETAQKACCILSSIRSTLQITALPANTFKCQRTISNYHI